MEFSMKTGGSSPEIKASLPSLLTWHWIQTFVTLGNRKTIEAEDLYEMNPKETTQHCEKLWKNALEKEKGFSDLHSMPPVWKLLWLCLGWEYSKAALVLKPVWLTAVILQVYILRALVKVVASKHNLKWWWGLILVIGMFVTSSIMSIAQHYCFILSQKVAMKIRSIVSMAVFNKLLSTRLVALGGANSGSMLNLITNDTQKLLDAATYFHFVWFGLVEIATVSGLAIVEVGVSAIPGVFVAFITQPIQVWMAHVVGRLRNKAVKYTDARVHLTREILNGIRVIKYNGWVTPFLQHIAVLRHDEISRIKMASFVRASTSTIRDSATPLASLVTFGTYFAIHKRHFMPASQAFTVLALFSVLVRTFSIAPLGFQFAGEAIIAINRLKRFLALNDANDLELQDDYEKVSREHPNKAVMVTDCSFSWNQKKLHAWDLYTPKSDKKLYTELETHVPRGTLESKRSVFEFIIQEINLVVSKGKFISIQGPVGSGKSSLLSGILGEMQCLKGKYFIQRNVAYVPQQPWILNTTVHRNIVFASPFDLDRYQNTIAACALEHDILQFPGGHETEIGDRGINLSGGQKARISLARACYSSAPVVILDDPLAAVDVPTAKHLIEHVLNGILKGRTVILVTHNETALDISDHAYMMENGHLHNIPKSNTVADSETSLAAKHELINNSSHSEEIEEENASILIDSVSGSNTKEADFALSPTVKPQSDKEEPVNGQMKGSLTVKEDRVEGNIKSSTWIAYGKASGGLYFFSFVILIFLLGQAVRAMVDYWLRVWTDGKYNLSPRLYIAIYAVFTVSATFFSLCRALLFAYASILAATGLHSQMAERVLRSPQMFFDQNTTGRILNRFSKDQSLVDELLPNVAQQMLEYAASSFGSLIMIGVLIPWFLLAFPPFIFIFFYLKQKYVAVSRELRRLEAVSRSPMYAHFAETFQGIVSVRAYGVQSKMHSRFMSLIDANHSSYILFVHLGRWLGVRLDFATNLCVTLTSILVILLRHSISPGLAGVVLVQSLQVTGFMQFAVRQAGETENYLTSVERIHAYTNLPTEADPTTGPGIIDEDWPSKGEIEFHNYTMTYREDLSPVLNQISFKVNAKEKVGILGRTGVGKSSLAAALFRMVENAGCSGEILIDGINTKVIGLDDLRRRLSIIPQDPILFQGSLRFNLDPFQAYTDAEIFDVLSRVHLTEKIQSLGKGLDCLIEQNGENFSVGQRQLICLARSLLRRSRIIVMDEATAAVDGETDSLIQTTIRTAFDHCTVLTIAHRIETVIDCDRIMILTTGGFIAEFDSPSNLLDHQGNGRKSIFAEMVEKTGPTTSQKLYDAAHAAERRQKEQKGESN